MSFFGGQIDFIGGYTIYLVIILVSSALNWFPWCLCEFLGWIYDFLGSIWDILGGQMGFLGDSMGSLGGNMNFLGVYTGFLLVGFMDLSLFIQMSLF
jgi:hypothetical protein